MGKLLTSHPSLFCDTKENFGFHQAVEFRYFPDWPELLYPRMENYLTNRTWNLIKSGLIANLMNKCDKLSAQKLGDKTPDQDLSGILHLFPRTHIIVMLRDYRDVCLSWAFHATRGSGSWKGWFGSAEKKALDNRFLSVMLNYYESKRDFAVCSRFAKLKPNQVLIVKYEDMKSLPVPTLKGVFDFLGVDNRDSIVENCLRLNSFERSSRGRRPGEADHNNFYRKGIVGDWKNHFSPENIALFKEISGETLIAAGYEQNNDWGL